MKNLLAFLLLILFLSSCTQTVSDEHFYDPGISMELAKYRKQQLSNLHYTLDFSIPNGKDAPIQSELQLSLAISNLDHPLILDFNEKSENILSISVNGNNSPIVHQQEHIIIAPKYLKSGINQITIEFIAGNLSLNRNEDFLYTLLVPDRASTLFPCFDQPDLKGRYTLSITAPKEWEVLAGAPEVNSTQEGAFIKHEFGPTDLMSTYLFSFVAGEFNTANTLEAFPQKMLYRETNPEKIEASIPEVFELHRKSKEFLEEYTAYPFPFQKLDFATIPIFQYGGMEHVGAIQYRESALFLDGNATDSELLSRAKLIGHETAHMWFGDLVSIEWFNDVWMKEVFAGFMAGKIANPNYPKINHDLAFLTSNYPAAYGEDRTAGTNPIRQNLPNLKDAGSLYGSIIYSKAPIMMRQLETAMGEEAFQKGIQAYIKSFANGNANWNDLVSLLDQETPLDLQKWSDIWVNQSGRPLITEQISFAQDGTISSLSISQQAEDGSNKLWPQLFDITLVYPDRQITIPVSIEGKNLVIEEAKGLEKPETILYNSNGLGYGVFPLDQKATFRYAQLQDEVMRAHAYINLYENTLLGNIPAENALNVIREGIATEQNEILMRLLSSEANSLFWTYLSEDSRTQILPEFESQIWDLLQSDLDSNIKKSLFSLYSGIAYSKLGTEKLYSIWHQDQEIQNLKLNSDNFTSLAMTLALYKHPDSEAILEEERARLSNPDKLNRFDFLRPALSQNPEERDQLFESFKDAKNREKESWVLAACGYIHHPLHQEHSIKYVPLSLGLLEEIQKTGDIFFPKRWISSTVGQYTSEQAANDVKNFLNEHPDFNPILKNKILQATDDLMRVQKIASKK
ncbi:M1 family metallopeptidase [Algoriphagus halophilus]|uniref:Aminopeptidase N n=1 Tax=Algoriphagus halophilus TaxID=226505 RepID=A0A1N6D2M7_9BACT|nr:M1 family aminopeptidase [Algoriphagus halophilus]SIN64947.1 aminopeptidase N [Algoriphagus halophilus]